VIGPVQDDSLLDFAGKSCALSWVVIDALRSTMTRVREHDRQVLEDLDDLRAVLRGTCLERLPVRKGPDGDLVISGVPPEQVLDAWSAARALMPITGRWPVGVGGEKWFWRNQPDTHQMTPEMLAAFTEAAERAEPWRGLTDRYTDIPHEEVDVRHREFPDPALIEEAVRELALPVDVLTLSRWIYDRVRTDPARRAAQDPVSALYRNGRDWYQPEKVELVLLASDVPWMPALWVSYFGHEPVEFGAALLQWNRRWGVELVACWGTMAQFVVRRPPSSGQQAWEASLQMGFMGGSLQDPLWRRALALEGTGTWFLHERP